MVIENRPNGENLEVYETFPFMESFPFGEYAISLEKEGTDPGEMGISPILLKTLGSFGTENHFNFSYIENENAFSISFYQEDIAAIAEIAVGVKKMNSIVEDFNEGLVELDLLKKIEHVKRSKKFIKSLELQNLLFAPMGEVLEDILKLHEVVLPSKAMLSIQKLQKIDDSQFTPAQSTAVLNFLNFQLNYAKILMGIVIAAKIH